MDSIGNCLKLLKSMRYPELITETTLAYLPCRQNIDTAACGRQDPVKELRAGVFVTREEKS